MQIHSNRPGNKNIVMNFNYKKTLFNEKKIIELYNQIKDPNMRKITDRDINNILTSSIRLLPGKLK